MAGKAINTQARKADIRPLSELAPLSYSRLKKFKKSEALFIVDRDDDPSEEQELGTAIHKLALEGREAFNEGYELGPVNAKTGKTYGKTTLVWEESKREYKGSKKWIESETLATMDAVNAELFKHKTAARLLSAVGSVEFHAESVYCGIPCHGYLDKWIPSQRIIVDLKTCGDIDSFESSMRRYDYAHQAAFYRSLCAAMLGCGVLQVACFLIAAETKGAYRVGVWRIGELVLAEAQESNEEAIERLKKCWVSGVWKTGYEELRLFDWI